MWEITKISATRNRDTDTPEWLVHWAGPYEPTWRKLGDLTGCSKELLRFELTNASTNKGQVSRFKFHRINGNSVYVEW